MMDMKFSYSLIVCLAFEKHLLLFQCVFDLHYWIFDLLKLLKIFKLLWFWHHQFVVCMLGFLLLLTVIHCILLQLVFSLSGFRLGLLLLSSKESFAYLILVRSRPPIINASRVSNHLRMAIVSNSLYYLITRHNN